MTLARHTSILTRRLTPGAMAAFACAAVIGLVITSAMDQWVYEAVVSKSAQRDDWYRALRITGYLPPWLVLAVVFLLVDMTSHRKSAPQPLWSRAAFIAAAPTLAGLAAELFKLVARRERPSISEGLYVFRPVWEATFSTHGLGMPSSHAAVSFGGALAMCYLFPVASPVFLLVSIGCAITRFLDHSHFLSDAYVAFFISLISVYFLIRIGLRPEEPTLPARSGH